ncbi:MAG: peptidylprolyl isomerase [Bacteroidota bacterium]
MRYAAFLVSLLFVAACLPVEKTPDATSFSLEDSTVRTIFNLQDERKTSDLLKFLSDENPGYRYLATSAFGSVQDSLAIDSLDALLDTETFEPIRQSAAYALGQIQHPDGAKVIIRRFQSETSRTVQSAMLEAIGRCGTKEDLLNLGKIKTYQASDTLLQEGLVKGIYRFCLRGITDRLGTKKVIDILQIPGISPTARLYASAYLQRAPNIDLNPFESTLVNLYLGEESADSRMFLAAALGKANGALARETLNKALATEKDYRVKCNILRAMTSYPFEVVKQSIFTAASDSNVHVAAVASSLIGQNGGPDDVQEIMTLANAANSWQTKSNLLGAALRCTPYRLTKTKDFYSKGILDLYKNSANPYEKAALITALSEHLFNYPFIAQQTFAEIHPAISTAGVGALTSIRSHEDFNRMFGSRSGYAKRELDVYIKQAIESQDIALIGIAAGFLRNPDLDYKSTIGSLAFLETARDQLELPKDMETHIELQKTINFLSDGPEVEDFIPEFNHPIEWNAVSVIPDSTAAEIITSRGTIKLILLTKAAPGSASNFASLAKSGFYDKKNFHRVVPNFVVQGGCPRGDGWGSLDYSIRSEVGPLTYDAEGYVGMASAGKDTECTQWFITHSPTPHLDGRYTIFAKVVDGMNVVHNLQIGDQIERIVVK